MTDNQKEFLSLCDTAFSSGSARMLVFSNSTEHGIKKLRILPRTINGKTVFVTERTLTDGRVTQKNSPVVPSRNAEEAFSGFLQVDLCFAKGSAIYKRNKIGSEALICPAPVRRAALGKGETVIPLPLENTKKRMLTGAEPFLRELGISDGNGTVLPTRQAKFRQICRFLEFVRDILPALPKEGGLRVYDLCYGKCYLSFAVYHYLRNILGRNTEMLCVDRKEDVIADCRRTAEKLGFDGMRFLCEDIRRLDDSLVPDLVLSLHACDTATDVVLETAVRLGAAAILSTPCCHRELSRKIDCRALHFALRFGVLSDKLCTVLTDGLRALRLECDGYTVCAAELTDPDDTPKNVLLRATRGITPARRAESEREYRAALSFLGLSDRQPEHSAQ